MFYKFNYLLYAIIYFVNIKSFKTFNVNFQYNYNLQVEPFNTQIYKRELTQFFDKASFSLNGFEKIESVPVLFPIDICIFNLEGVKYATALHVNKNGARHFKVLKMNNGSYELIADIPTYNAIAMDCINFNNKGYVAIALNLTEAVEYAKEGSPIYEISGDHVKPIQYFADTNLLSVYLQVSGNDFFLLHTHSNSQETPNLHCPYFKWSGSTFNKIGHIPCSNARQLIPFSINYESFVAVANYADQRGRTSTHSEIFKYSRDNKKFVLFQRIKTNGAVDVQYFNVPFNDVKITHYLVFGNSISTASLERREKAKREGKNLEADSVFYLYDKGHFIPYQKLSLYAVKKFLPVQNVEAEKFILLVACTDQDIKIYNLNDWKFVESNVQFTEGALGKGVANMRIYQEQEKSYLIIANELMADNETNIFLPIFKHEERENVLRQQIIDWTQQEFKRLQTINIKDLTKQVENKLRKLEHEHYKYLPMIKEIPEANIETVTTESLIYPKLKMYSNYWTALIYIHQALDNLENLLQPKQRLKRETKMNSYENLEHVYDTLNVNTLNVNKSLKAIKVNKVNTQTPEFQNIKAQKVIVKNKYITPSIKGVIPSQSLDHRDESDMIVRNLQVNGKLNGFLWKNLVNNTLKRKGDIQFLKAPVQIESLKADSIVVNNDKVNGQNLKALIPTDSGSYVINQDIQFAAPITAKQVNIFERLNNLHVFNNKFDVLLKKSNKTQFIRGRKNVTNIIVLEPITTAGKMIGHHVEPIISNKLIHEPLVLQGSFSIKGDVHINHQLKTLDIVDIKEMVSAKQFLDMGLRMDKSFNGINLKFLHPLMANNSLVSFVNQHDLQRLVKFDFDDMQIIEGFKIFNETLEISKGCSKVKNINGVDVENLKSNAFLSNNNQTIGVPMKIGKISAKGIESPLILLHNKKLSDYLTLTGNQSIQGSLITDNFKTQFLAVEHLNTDNKIFHQHIQDIYQQKSLNPLQSGIFQKNRKFHGSIYVQNLILNTTINNKTIEEIESLLLPLEGNIKYVGNFKLNYAMNITNMTYLGKLNDIPAEELGKSWLQRKAEKQEFTASQTFAGIEAEDGIELEGKLNGFTMKDFYSNTYWINRDEYIEAVNFKNPIEVPNTLTTQTLNNYKIPEDMIYKKLKDEPIVLNSLTFEKNVIVEGTIFNLTSVNNINLRELKEFLQGSRSNTLYVEQAYFPHTSPVYKTLNGYYIKNTLDSVWLTNENVVLPHHVEIADAYFEGLLEFEGPINNMNLDYLKENYFSKSKPQEVTVEMVYSEGAQVNKEINVNELQVFGPLIETKSGTSFNFNEFVQNTLKTAGPHIISGNWYLLGAKVQGNLNKVLINKLNLLDDIVHTVKSSQPYQLKAPKIFKNLLVNNLYADTASLVNRVPINYWTQNTVYLYKNYTIQGITSIDSLNVYNNVIVLGKVNNITFNEQNLLLQNIDQHVPCKMKIVSHLANERHFLTNNIQDLYTDYINRQYLTTFMENLVPAATNIQLKSHLIFKHVLKLEKYEGPEGYLTQNQWTKRHINEDNTEMNRAYIERTDEMFEEFNQFKEYLKKCCKSEIYKLDNFDITQTLEVKSTEIIMLSLKSDTMIKEILAVFDMQNRNITIYEYLPKIRQFQKCKDCNWLPQDPLSLKIIQKKFEIFQQPINVTDLKIFIEHDFKTIYKILKRSQNVNNYFEFLNENCMIYLDTLTKELMLYCLNNLKAEKLKQLSYEKQHFVRLNANSLALIANSSVLIYNSIPDTIKIPQKLSTANPKQMVLGSFQNFRFLAILSNGHSKSLNHGFVDIYRSINSSSFELFQSLECWESVKIEFSLIETTNDLLLHILTDSFVKPYLIYQYQGILGFQEILSDSILPANFVNVSIFKVYSSNNYLVALIGEDKITLVQIATKQIL